MIFPRPVLVAAVLLFVCRASHGAERSFQHDFDPVSSQSLTLSTYRGSVTVEAADRPGVRVEALVEAQGKDDKELDRRLDEVEITFSQDGPSLVVKGALRNHSKVRFDWGDDDRVDIAYRVIVPRRTSVTLETNDGSITVGDGVGSVAATARVGTLYLKHIDGSVQAQTQTGDIIVSRCSGTAVLTALSGNIRVGSVGGRATLKTSSGEIELQDARGGVDALAEAGDIAVGFPAALAEASKVHADGGSVSARLDPAARCTIVAKSTWGHVSSTLPLVITAGGIGRSSLSGTLNGGGPEITLIANGGHVKLQPGSLGPVQ